MAEKKGEADAALEYIKSTRRENQRAGLVKNRQSGYLSLLGGPAFGNEPVDITGGPQPKGGGPGNVSTPTAIAGAMARYK